MSEEDYKKVQSHLYAAQFVDVLSNINKKHEYVKMLEDMIIYNTGKTKQEIKIMARQTIRKGMEAFIKFTDEDYIKFLNDYIDCNFDLDATMTINEL